jgi:transposase
MDTNPLFTIALGLMSPWEVQRTEFDADRRVLRLRVNFTVGSRFECPECGASSCPVHDTVEKEWRHLDFFQHQAFISARVPRISCAKCGVRLVTVPWARPGSNFTMLMEALLLELVRQMPVHGVAKLTGISDSALWRVIYHHVDAAVRRIDCSRLVQVGVDETSARKGHDYISCFFDMVSRRLVFATEGREHEVVAAFARFLGAHNGDSSTVRDVSCDMSPAFIKGVREHLPNACVTFDKFHVVKILSDAMERVRRSEWRHDKIVKGGRWALLKNPEHLDLPPEFRTRGLAHWPRRCGQMVVGQDAVVLVGGRNPGGAGAKRRTGGQTASQSTTPGRKIGRRAVRVSRLRREVEHGASLQDHAACVRWVCSKASGDW